MELGDTATAFEYEGYGENLARCQRYYEVIAFSSYGRVGNSLNATDTAGHAFDFKVTKRAAPTMTYSDIGRSSGEFTFTTSSGNYVSTDPDTIAANLTINSATIYAYAATNIAGLTNDSISCLYVNGTGYLKFASEL